MTIARLNAVDLVVIGPPKSGTSTIFATLESHPAIDVAHAKEPLFFMTEQGLDLGVPDGPARSGGYERGMSWYEDLFRRPQAAIRLEGSTDYFPSPSSPGLLAAHAPSAHVVVCLREPAQRLVSQYWHERRFSELPDLGEMVANDHPRLRYWRRCGQYGTALGRWLEHVPAERLHVVSFEDIREDATGTANTILGALGLPPLVDAGPLDDAGRNAAGTSRSTRLHRWLTVSPARRAAEELPDWIQRPLRNVARRAMRANLDRGDYPPTPPEVLAELRAQHAEDRVLLLGLSRTNWPDVVRHIEAWPT